MDRRGIQPQHDGVPADWSAYDGCLRKLSHQQQLHDAADNLRWVPPGGFQRDDKSKPRQFRIPDRLHAMPFDYELDFVDLQSRDDLPAGRVPRHIAVRAVPHNRDQLQRIVADNMLRMPHGGFHGNYESESRLGGLPNDLRYLPHKQ
jgi:hypothetical protein